MMTWRRGDLRDELVWELDRHGMTLAVPSPTLVTSVTRVTPGQPPWIPTLPTPWSGEPHKGQPSRPSSPIFIFTTRSMHGWRGSGQQCSSSVSPTMRWCTCLLYTSDAADEEDSVDLGGRRIIKKK